MYNFEYFNKYSWLFWRHVNFNVSVMLIIYMFEKEKKEFLAFFENRESSIQDTKWELRSDFWTSAESLSHS